MNLRHDLILSVMIIFFANGCSTYSTEDYGASDVRKNQSSCLNMEPAQEMKCKEKEESLLIGLGADKNCNHPYEYERNRCKSEQAKQKKALAQSLEKHKNKL
jgi:hypothetical protein